MQTKSLLFFSIANNSKWWAFLLEDSILRKKLTLFLGECWSGLASADYSRDGISQNCVGKDFKECSCNSYHCVGKAYTNYVYRLDTGSLDDLMDLIYT